MNKIKSSKNVPKNYIPLLCFAAILLLGALSILLYRLGISRIVQSTADAYTSTSSEVFNNTYSEYYNLGESDYHLSTNAEITIQSIREIDNLEVLTVASKVFIPSNDGKIWSEISGSSNFFVNMQLAEYIADSARKYILVRIPKPTLSENLQLIDWKEYDFTNGGILENIKSSIKDGVDFAVEANGQAKEQILNNLRTNQDYPQRARESAKMILTSLIKGINPDIKDLTVDVEFY